MDWAISSQAPNRGRFNDYPGRGSRSKRSEMGNPKPLMRHGEDIVCASQKCGDARNGAEQEWRPCSNITDLTGEYGDKDFIVMRGDSRVSMILPLDEKTLKLNRTNRFLIDDYFDDRVLAYRLTKPFKLGGSYGDNGVLAFVLVECNTEDDDNLKLHIADYYKYFPRVNGEGEETGPTQWATPGEDTGSGRKWL